MNFGKWIVVSFVLFAGFIACLVVICIRQDINLVSANYYQEELAHQHKMEIIQNTHALQSLPVITLEGTILTVSYSDFDKIETGELKLLRPSDDRLDKKFQMSSSTEKTQRYPLDVWGKGLYRASMQWKMEGKEFYYEKLIVL